MNKGPTDRLPVIGVILVVLGVIALIAGVVMWVLPSMPRDVRIGVPTLGVALFALGFLTNKYHHDKPARPWRLGVGIYCFSFFMMAAAGASMYFVPEKPAVVFSKAEARKVEEGAAERARNRTKREERIQEETRVMTTGTYAEGVALRTERFVEHAKDGVGFATLLTSMFLIGTWFVRSGIMDNARAHLPLFRKLAVFGLPLGIGLGLIGSAITVRAVPGANGADGWQLASGLQMLGNLPASLGYISLVVLMLHSASIFNKVGVLAPFGRMALTNYLSQSLIGTVFYFGYGFGHIGASRVDQTMFVAVVIVLQIAFSHFWLARFRHGPMEWLWRAFAYWTIPPMRVQAPARLVVAEAPA